MGIQDATLDAFSPGATSLEDLPINTATLLGQSQNGAMWVDYNNDFIGGLGFGVFYDTEPGMSPTGTWFEFDVSNQITYQGSYQQYADASAGSDDYLSLRRDPTLGTIQYVAPNSSKVKFTNYPITAIQRNVIEYDIGIAINDCFGLCQEYFGGYWTSAPPPTPNNSPLYLSSLTIDRAPGSCGGDDRDSLIAQYAQTWQDPNGQYYSIPLALICSDFTQTASSANYSYQDFMVSNSYSWGLVRYPLVVPASLGYGFDYLVQLIGGELHPLTSGYRGPADNERVGRAFKRASRHMFGDAVDMVNFTQSKAEHDTIEQLAKGQAGAGYVEPLSGPCAYRCVHVDWRSTNGLYAP